MISPMCLLSNLHQNHRQCVAQQPIFHFQIDKECFDSLYCLSFGIYIPKLRQYRLPKTFFVNLVQLVN